MATLGSSTPDASFDSNAGTEDVYYSALGAESDAEIEHAHVPTPGSVVEVDHCVFCGDVRKGVVGTKGYIDMVKKLWRDRSDDRSSRERSWLDRDGDVRDKWTDFQWTAAGGHDRVVRFFLDADPRPNVMLSAEDGLTALHLAARGGHTNIVLGLLNGGASAHVNAQSGNTDLHFASREGHIQMVQVLLRKDLKVDVNAKGYDDCTPLHLASKGGHVDVVQALPSNDPTAEVNAKDDYGQTPLQLALSRERRNVVQVLLNAHPKPHLNIRGRNYLTTVNLVDGMHEWDANNFQESVATIATIISKHIGEENFKSVAQMAYKSSEGPIWQELIQKDPIKNYLEVLYKDRQAYVDAANAILVGAALIASMTFGSWLQPLLNYTIAGDMYTSMQSSRSMSPSSSYDPNYVDLEHNMPLRVFWVFNCLSFYFAIATVVFGACSVLPRKRLFIQQTVIKLRRNLLVTSIFLGFSVLFVTIAFGITGCIVLAPIIKFQLYMIVPTCIGGLVCLFSLLVLFKNIVEDQRLKKNNTKEI